MQCTTLAQRHSAESSSRSGISEVSQRSEVVGLVHPGACIIIWSGRKCIFDFCQVVFASLVCGQQNADGDLFRLGQVGPSLAYGLYGCMTKSDHTQSFDVLTTHELF